MNPSLEWSTAEATLHLVSNYHKSTMFLIDDGFLPFALSYLANNVPSLNSFLEKQKSFDSRVKACYDRARKQWKCSAAKEQYEGKEFEHLEDLKQFLVGDRNGMDSEILELVGNWVLEMRKDPACATYINEIKTEGLLAKNSDELMAIATKMDELKSVAGDIGRIIEDGLKLILQHPRRGSHFWENENDKALVLIDDYLSGKNRSSIPGFLFGGNKLKDGSLWSDTVIIERITEDLTKQGVMLVKAAEGRGKSILCLQVAYGFFQKGFSVFITQKSWDWEQIRDLVEEIIINDLHAVVIMEDVHKLSTESNDVIDFIKTYCRNRESGNDPFHALFLMNLRPSLEGEEDLEINTLPDDYLLDLTSDSIQESRSRELTDYLVSYYHLDMASLRVERTPLQEAIPPNLKILSAYFDIYTDPKRPSNIASESKVLHLYIRNYGLHNATQQQIDALGFLGSLGFFDAPVDVAFLSEEEEAYLNNYRDQGLCYQVYHKYYMSHSTDARFLCLALCSRSARRKPLYKDLIEDISKAIKQYGQRILAYRSMPEDIRLDVESDFVSPILMPLYQMEGFEDLSSYFREVRIASKIVEKLSPTFILAALTFHDDNDLSRKKIYLRKIAFLRDNITKIPFATIVKLSYTMKKYYGYGEKVMEDLFGDSGGTVLLSYLRKRGQEVYYGDYSSSRKIIQSLGDVHKDLIVRYGLLYKKDSPYNYSGISIKEARVITHEIVLLYAKGERTLLGSIHEMEEIMDCVKDSLSLSRDQEIQPHLSLLFHDIGIMSVSLYERCIREEVFVKEVDYIMKDSIVSSDSLYYLSRYYRSDLYEKERIDQWIQAQMRSNREIMEKWIETVQNNNPQSVLNESFLAYSIKQMLSDNKN